MKTALKVAAALLLVIIVSFTAVEFGYYRLNSAVKRLKVAQSNLNKIYLRDKEYPKTFTVAGLDDSLYSYSSSNGYFYIDCTIQNLVSEDIRLTVDPVSIDRIEAQDERSEKLYVDLSILREIANMDPEKELAKAVADEDFRFVAVYGYSKSVPGIDDYYEKYESTYGDWAIPGTGDTWYGDEHLALIRLADQFATSYNQRLLETINKSIVNSTDVSL